MESIVDWSYTRLTLSLDIIKKIEDGEFKGFHELGIIKHQINLGDKITITPSLNMKMSCNHPNVPKDSRNICWAAVDLLKKECSVSENLSIDIDKNIPVEGGLAGGSTNAASVLKMVNKLWQLGLSKEKLIELGRTLGMDVPFYFYGSTAFDSEATKLIRPIKNSEKLHFALIVPPFGVSTADAYGGIDYSKIGKKVLETENLEKAFEDKDLSLLANLMHNDFELTVFHKFRELEIIKAQLLERGSSSVILSGSGSTMVALAESKSHAVEIASGFKKSIVSESVL
jgi:4-diphosphocytidyl-2-C-methyl-D-erythritol kinase